MNRHILLRITAPTLVIGLVLFGTAMASVWSINRLQRNLGNILSENVSSLVAAQDLEIRLRQLRFHSLMYLMDPIPARQAKMEKDHKEFERSLKAVRESINTPEEQKLIETVQSGYQRYRRELAETQPLLHRTRDDYIQWADAHPVRHVSLPCQELLRVNKDLMEKTALESEAVTKKTRTGMIMLGLLGPLSGIIVGYGVARGLSRSMARLVVRLEDVRARLDQDVASVKFSRAGGAADIDRQLDLVIARVREVTEQAQRHQHEILRAEQLAAIGQLAASLAHEIRNPLTGIKLLVGATLSTQNEPPLSVDDLQVIHDEVVRLEGTVQGLLDYARPPKVCREWCDLRDIITQAVDLVRARANHQQIDLQVRVPAEPVRAFVDRRQLGNVVVNLLMNSLDAVPREGSIWVHVDVANAGHAHVLVRDSGPGLSEEVADRLFVPFVSSKPTGTGLGLSVCQRVIREHGGTIAGRSASDGGAEFEIDLPTGEEVALATAPGHR
jgi:signal transduction histidine kinase